MSTTRVRRPAVRASVPFARALLVHGRVRTVIALGGICFAVLFMYLQLGLLGAALHTATAVSSRLNADVVLVSPRFVHITAAGNIPRSRLYQALADPAVASAAPLYMRMARWRAVETRRTASLIALGISTGEVPSILLPELDDATLAALQRNSTMIVDRASNPRVGDISPGTEPEVRERRVQVVGNFELGVGFVGDGAIVVGDHNFLQLFESQSPSEVHMGLLKLRPGADVREAIARLQDRLPADVRVMSLAELNRIQRRHWVADTSLGIIFSIGTIVGFVIGLAVLYQTLSTDLMQQLPQYATLKSMGYPDGGLRGLVLRQSFGYAAASLLPATLLAVGVYALLRSLTHLPVHLHPVILLSVSVLVLLMTAFAGLLAYRRLALADPADLFA